MTCTCNNWFFARCGRHAQVCPLSGGHRPEDESKLYQITRTPPAPEMVNIKVELGPGVIAGYSINNIYGGMYKSIYGSLKDMEQFHRILGLAIKEAKDG